jgi:hypothetical protein
MVLSGVFHAPWNVTVAPILEYGSGQPWTHRLGYDFNGDGKNSDRPAGVGRNTNNGPKYKNVSLRLTKEIALTGYGALQAIAEGFNLFNFKTLMSSRFPAASSSSGPTIANPKAAAVANPNFGKFLATLPAREFQLGLRWVY